MCDRQIMTNVACFWQPGLGKIMQSGAYSLHAPAKEVFNTQIIQIHSSPFN